MKNKKQYAPSHMLILGENEKKNNVYIQEDNRMKHILVVGTKGSGKSTGVLPALVKQDIEDKKVGATIVVGEKDTAMLLYAMAKRAGRDVVIIKPSLTDSGKMLLIQRNYQYDAVKLDVLDYEKAVTKRQIVIIDMEFARHHESAIRGVAYLLTSLNEAVVKVNEVTVTKHFLYVDDAHLYLPFMKNILYSGKEYGVGCTLFLESRLQLLDIGERALVDSYIGNTVLMSGLTVEDSRYYVEDIYEKQIPFIRNRGLKDFIYSTTDREGRRTTGAARFEFLPDELVQSLRMAIPRYRGGIEREQVGVSPPVKPKTDSISTAKVVEVEPKSPPVKKEIESVPEKKASQMNKTVSEAVETQSHRHVVILDNEFDEDEEF